MSYLAVSNGSAGGFLDAALADAEAKCAFTGRYSYWDETFAAKPGTTGSRWGAGLLTGTGAITQQTTGVRGSVTRLTTGATAASQVELISVINGLGIYGSSMMDDLVAATSKWYVTYAFRLITVPDAVTRIEMGWVKSDSTPGPMLGVRGASGTTNFRTFLSSTATGVDSTVAIDANNWHVAKMWNNGATSIKSQFDSAAYTTFSPAWGGNACPYVLINNGATAAAQTIELSDCVYVFDSN